MPSRALMRAFLALWVITGVVLFYGSVMTAREGLRSGGHSGPHLVLLGGVEAAAALIFLVPRAMRWGAAGLLLTIGVAFAVHAAMGQFRGDLVLYAATVTFVMVHGPLTRDQFARAMGSDA